jgi:hypothetical protein
LIPDLIHAPDVADRLVLVDAANRGVIGVWSVIGFTLARMLRTMP